MNTIVIDRQYYMLFGRFLIFDIWQNLGGAFENVPRAA